MSERISPYPIRRRLLAAAALSGSLLLASLAPWGGESETEKKQAIWEQVAADKAAVQPVVPAPAPGSKITILSPDVAPSHGAPNFETDMRKDVTVEGQLLNGGHYDDCERDPNSWVTDIITQGQEADEVVGIAGSWALEPSSSEPGHPTYAAILEDGVAVRVAEGGKQVEVTPLQGETRTFDRTTQGDFQQYETAMGHYVTTGLVEVGNDIDFVVNVSCGPELPPIFAEGWNS